MLYDVTIIATGIEVTADNYDEAERYAKEDASEFAQQWRYEVGEIVASGPHAEEDDDIHYIDFDFYVDNTDEDDGTWTFDASIDVCVEAESPKHAADKAKVLFATLGGDYEIDPEAGTAAIAKILDYRAKQGNDVAAVISQIPLDKHDAEGMIHLAREAVSVIPHTDPAYDTLSRIYAMKRDDHAYDVHDATGILSLASEFATTAATQKPSA